MNWINLNKNPPTKKEGFVLGVDWYPGDKKDDLRILVCELPTVDGYWCGQKKGKVLNVFNSICPCVGNGQNAHWMEIPSDNWIPYVWKDYPYQMSDYHEVIIKLKNGNFYTGFIEQFDWCPSFNMFRHGSLDEIDFWRELPKAPDFISPPDLSEEEKEIERKWREEFCKHQPST